MNVLDVEVGADYWLVCSEGIPPLRVTVRKKRASTREVRVCMAVPGYDARPWWADAHLLLPLEQEGGVESHAG